MKNQETKSLDDPASDPVLAELASIEQQIGAAENAEQLRGSYYRLKQRVELLEDQQKLQNSMHVRARQMESAIVSRRSEAEKALYAATVDLERVKNVANAPGLDAAIRWLIDFDSAIQALQFFLNTHAAKVAAQRKNCERAKSCCERATADVSSAKKELAEAEAQLRAITPEDETNAD